MDINPDKGSESDLYEEPETQTDQLNLHFPSKSLDNEEEDIVKNALLFSSDDEEETIQESEEIDGIYLFIFFMFVI